MNRATSADTTSTTPICTAPAPMNVAMASPSPTPIATPMPTSATRRMLRSAVKPRQIQAQTGAKKGEGCPSSRWAIQYDRLTATPASRIGPKPARTRMRPCRTRLRATRDIWRTFEVTKESSPGVRLTAPAPLGRPDLRRRERARPPEHGHGRGVGRRHRGVRPRATGPRAAGRSTETPSTGHDDLLARGDVAPLAGDEQVDVGRACCA